MKSKGGSKRVEARMRRHRCWTQRIAVGKRFAHSVRRRVIISAMAHRSRKLPAGTIARWAVGCSSALCALAIGLAACTPARQPLPAASAPETAAAAVTRRPIPATAPTTGTSASPAIAVAPGAVPQPPGPTVVVPAGAIYVCVSESGGTPQHTAIGYEGKTDALCRKHPEMGPCQYERNACRRGGGRVYAADGTEITMTTEAEYDRKVWRVQFRAN